MKKVLITGGSGTVGKSFIQFNYNEYEFFNVSRNEKLQDELKKDFPKVQSYLASVENKEQLFNIYDKVRPDIVIHAAAVKHINLAEKQPIQTCRININGSLNVLDASVAFATPITVAISTDKACDSRSIYGVSKYLMEKCFVEADSSKTRFSVCRFANVAKSNGSVIPFWLELKEKGLPLQITNPDMNRMMFSKKDAVDLVKKSIELAENGKSGIILSKLMKTVNINQLARLISDKVEIVGAREGEKINEDLISQNELPFTKMLRDRYIMIEKEISDPSERLDMPWNSANAPKMNNDELFSLIYN